ncbi:hypothetical protein WN943_021349 [Citrus x changshan-huyou]
MIIKKRVIHRSLGYIRWEHLDFNSVKVYLLACLALADREIVFPLFSWEEFWLYIIWFFLSRHEASVLALFCVV